MPLIGNTNSKKMPSEIEQSIRRLRAMFPNASRAFIKANLGSLHPNHKKPSQRGALVGEREGEVESWHGAAKRFEITFRIYSTTPCDYDGYDIKPIQDMLVRAQIIPDDKWNLLSGRVVSCKARTKSEEKTEIEIIAIHED